MGRRSNRSTFLPASPRWSRASASQSRRRGAKAPGSTFSSKARRPSGKFTALAGSVALACILAPIVARTTEEMVRLVPNSLREAALALGYQRWRTSLTVVVRTAGAGIITGCLVAVARVAGETAPLRFTALGNQFFSTRVLEPMAALPLQVYVYALGPYDEWHRQAWAGALVLILLVLILGTIARITARARRAGA